jgi:hypothetical protein
MGDDGSTSKAARIGLEILGWLLLAAGVAALVLPGPGLLALALIGIGVYWGVRPAAPGWWPLEAKWWLFGGWGTGVFLIASGLLALGLLGWSMKNFRYGDSTLEEVYESHHLKEGPRRPD